MKPKRDSKGRFTKQGKRIEMPYSSWTEERKSIYGEGLYLADEKTVVDHYRWSKEITESVNQFTDSQPKKRDYRELAKKMITHYRYCENCGEDDVPHIVSIIEEFMGEEV